MPVLCSQSLRKKEKEKKIGHRGCSLGFLRSFLSDRTFQVLVANQVSSSYPVKSGIPQGSVLSPLLFAVLPCDIPHFPGVNLLMQVDDITFFVVGSSVEETQLLLQQAVSEFHEWTVGWGLEIKPEKSCLMCFTRK